MAESCVKLVGCEVVYKDDLDPPRDVVRLCLRIDCAGTWELALDTFIWCIPNGSEQSMTVLDSDNVFPIIVTSSDTGTVVYIYWDAETDDANLDNIKDCRLCVGLVKTVVEEDSPILDDPPPPPGGDGGVPDPLVPDIDEAVVVDVPQIGGVADDPSGDIILESPTYPEQIDTVNEGGTVASIPDGVPSSIQTIGFQVQPKVRAVDHPVTPQQGVGDAPVLPQPKDVESFTRPIVATTERREVVWGTVFKGKGLPGHRPGSPVTLAEPGQVVLLPADITPDSTLVHGNLGTVSNAIFSPGVEEQISVGSETAAESLANYPIVGDTLVDKTQRSNPKVDLRAREPIGDSSRIEPASYILQDPQAGNRIEPVAWHPPNKTIVTDANGNPIIAGSIVKQDGAADAPVAAFSLFSTPEAPRDGVEPVTLSLGDGRKLTPLGTLQDPEGDVPSVSQPTAVSFAGAQDILINDGRGRTYGIDAVRSFGASAPGIAFNTIPSDGLVSIQVYGYPDVVMRPDRVSVVIANIRNQSHHINMESMQILIAIVHSNSTYKVIGSQVVNVRPRSDISISVSVPPGIQPGPVQFVAILYGPDGLLKLSTNKAGYILPAAGLLGVYRLNEKLPVGVKQVLGIIDARTPIFEGRVWPYANPQPAKDFLATATIIAGAVKISQAGADRGFQSKVRVVVDPDGSPSTFVFTDGVKIGQADLFKGSHDTAFQVTGITIGTKIRICVENQKIEADPRFSWSMFGVGLGEITTHTFKPIGNGTHLAGTIETSLIFGRVRVRNKRTLSQIPLRTDGNGLVIISESGGTHNSNGAIITPTSSDTVAVFDARPGDFIQILSPGIAGRYNPEKDVLIEGDVLPDLDAELPTPTVDPDVVPDPPEHFPLDPVLISGDIIPRDGKVISGVGPQFPGDGCTCPPEQGAGGGAGIPPPPPPPPEEEPITPPPIIEVAWLDPEKTGIWTVECGNICQRVTNPCIVDVTVAIKAVGRFILVPELTMFSVDSTDCLDGNWYRLHPIHNDLGFSGLDAFDVNGQFNYTYVVDMCDHISSFFSEEKILFRLTFALEDCDLSEYGI